MQSVAVVVVEYTFVVALSTWPPHAPSTCSSKDDAAIVVAEREFLDRGEQWANTDLVVTEPRSRAMKTIWMRMGVDVDAGGKGRIWVRARVRLGRMGMEYAAVVVVVAVAGSRVSDCPWNREERNVEEF